MPSLRVDLRSRWRGLDKPRRIALAGIAIAAVGAVGPWSSGRLIYGISGGQSSAESVWGIASFGPVMLGLLAVAFGALLRADRTRPRAVIPSLALGAVALLAVFLLPSGGHPQLGLGATYAVDGVGWGLPFVILGCAIAGGGIAIAGRSPTR